MKRILLTGFEAFDGRTHNASWIAAQSAELNSRDFELKTLCLPVLWGEPQMLLTHTINDWSPQMIVSLGEGQPGRISLESRATNHRLRRADNSGCYPYSPIEKNGPESIKTSVDLARLQTLLLSQSIQTIISKDAGGFLCEEMLYVAERMRRDNAEIGLVLFVHLPPFATQFNFKGQQRPCDTALLKEFTHDLLCAVVSLYSNAL